MKVFLVSYVMIAASASALACELVNPAAVDHAEVQKLIEGRRQTHLTMPAAELKTLRRKAAQGWALEKFGVWKLGTLTINDGLWFTKNHAIETAFIIRIYKVKSGRMIARLEFPAG